MARVRDAGAVPRDALESRRALTNRGRRGDRMTERWKQYILDGLENAGVPTRFAVEQWMFLFPVYIAIRKALPSGGRVLDVGCGGGAFTSVLSTYGFEMVGVDQDADVVARAREVGRALRRHRLLRAGRRLRPLARPTDASTWPTRSASSSTSTAT